ncbi:MAG: Bro-N domain-containing protein [Clostridia bacterium]|nr:Bro-N domain-containing protein [Clostridia bacterium]
MNQELKTASTSDMVSLTNFFSETEMEGIDVLSDGDDLFFPAIECAKRLGYRNPRDAIRQHCEHESRTVDQIVVTGKHKDGSDAVQVVHKKYICEGDFYRLLFHSRLPIGRKFARWVTHEVLPCIRRYGFYPGRKFLLSLKAYDDALEEAIHVTHDYRKAMEASAEYRKVLDELIAAYPMPESAREDVIPVDLPATDTPTS